ncbi:MAG: L,D-transpeptidase family protein [Thermoleophilia bacterium]
MGPAGGVEDDEETVGMAMSSNRGRVMAAGIGGVAVVAAGAFGGWQLSTRPQISGVSPAPDTAVPTHDPNVVVRVSGGDRLGGLRVQLNGKDVTSTVRAANDRLVIPAHGLKDGPQHVAVSFHTGNLFARTVRRSWTFAVDTVAPALHPASPRQQDISRKHVVRFTGTAEAGSAVSVHWRGGQAAGSAGAGGAYAVTARLPEGTVDTTVAATDRAGNSTTAEQRLLVDTIAPVIALNIPKGGSHVSNTSDPRLDGTVLKDDPRLLTFGVTVNGKNVEAFSGASALPGTGSGTGLEPAAATSAPLEINGRRFSLAVTNLPQGANTVKVWAKDPAGNVSSQTTRIVVDSSEDFGTTDIRRGARGADITTLNQRLKDVHLLRGKVTSRFGPATEAAVLKYQKLHRLPRTGVVDQRTRNAMVGRIVVNLSQFTLRLIRDGRVVDKFKIAVGQPAYPTPTGNYQVVNMQMNPTWMPPNSPWAKGLGPIPPGPGNPLGTRWIGTSAPAVGIHGTYADSSIGTRASHGCMRMHIPDVEALYKDVVVGMPVIIKA